MVVSPPRSKSEGEGKKLNKPEKKKKTRKEKELEVVLLETVGLSRCSAALSKLELVPKLHAQIN